MTLPPPIQTTRSATNFFAIASLISAVLFAPVGIVLGVIALHEIRTTGQEGRSLALAGIWIGIVVTAIVVLFWTAFLLLMLWIFSLVPVIPPAHIPQ